MFLVTLLFSGSLCISAQELYNQSFDCFSMLVGKKASADGSVIFAHNEDTGPSQVNYFQVPRMKHNPGEIITLQGGGIVPQVSETFAYLWINIPVCDVCDSYTNEHGVAIGSDGCPSWEDKPELTDGGIVFWLRRIVAERARTAREGVKIAGELIDKFGYASSGRTYIIADSLEGWFLSAVIGKHWVARRVPDDQVAIVANCYTLQEINLNDTVNFLGSPDIIDYAIKRGWYDPAKDGEFRFARAYTSPGSLNHPGNTGRMWRGARLVTGAQPDSTKVYPFSVKPGKKLSVQDVISFQRDYYKTAWPVVYGNDGRLIPHATGDNSLSGNGTQYSCVVHLRNWLPQAIRTVVWISPYRPEVQTYTPWYPAISIIPSVYANGDYQSALQAQFNPQGKLENLDSKLAFRRFVALAKWADQDYGARAPVILKAMQANESEAFEMLSIAEKAYVETCQSDPGASDRLINKFTQKVAAKAYKTAGGLLK